MTYIALVLDLPVPVDAVDGVGNVDGDPGDGLEALDALIGAETLPIVGRIEKKENVFSELCTATRAARLPRKYRLGLSFTSMKVSG